MIESGLLDARYFQAVGSVVTATLAVIIYFQVKKIRQIEWLSKTNDAWNQFNNFLVATNSTSLFESFVAGESIARHEAAKARTIIFSYLNIVYSVATARRHELVLTEFADAMLNTHYGFLRRQREFVEPLLKDRGYADFFAKEIFPAIAEDAVPAANETHIVTRSNTNKGTASEMRNT